MSHSKCKLKNLRIRAASVGILTVSDLARLVPCSREAVYFAVDRPHRFSRVTRRIKELTNHDLAA